MQTRGAGFVYALVRGSRDSRWTSAQPAGSKWESALPTVNPQEAPADSQTLAASIYGG